MMRQWIWSVIPMLLVGCVSSGEYDRVRTQYEHLKDVKTEWDTEQDDLQQRMDAVHRAYSNVSKDQGALRLQQDQTKLEVARTRDDSRLLTGKLASQEARVSALDRKFSTVLDQLSFLAETNATLTNRVESLIAKMGALMARMKPVASRDSNGKAAEMNKAAAAKDGDNRPEDLPRGTVSKLGTNVQAQSASGDETRNGVKPESPAVEKAMQQLGVKAGPSVVGKGVGKASAPLTNGPVTEASKTTQGALDTSGRLSADDMTKSAAKGPRPAKVEQGTGGIMQLVGAPNAGTAAGSASLPVNASGAGTGAPLEALAAPPPGTLTFSPPPAVGSTVPPRGEKNVDGTQR